MGNPFDVVGTAIGSVLGAPAAHLIGGISDPIGKVVEVGCDVLGLPPEVRGAAKIGAGILTGSVATVVNGACDLGGTISAAKEKTEMGCSNAAGPSGYAAGPTATTHASTATAAGYTTVKTWENLSQPPYADWSPSGNSPHLKNVAMAFRCLPPGSPERAAQLQDLLYKYPDFKKQFESAFGCQIAFTDGFVNGCISVIRNVATPPAQCAPTAPSTPTYPTVPDDVPLYPLVPSQPQTPKAPQVPGNPNSPLDPNIRDYQEALRTLDANWETFDTAVGVRDQFLTRENLQALINNPNASFKLKSAARFLVDHPEYFNRLEMAAGVGGADRIVGWGDVKADLKRVGEEINKFGMPGVGGTDGSQPSGGNRMREILSDPSMSTEDKMMMIFQLISEGADDEMLEVGERMAAISEKKAGLEGKDAQKEAAKLDQSMQQLQLRMQRLMERKTQMQNLMSNFSSNVNEMAKTAIQNMGRA